MKQKLLYIIMFIAALARSNGVWGQQYYLLNDGTKYTRSWLNGEGVIHSYFFTGTNTGEVTFYAQTSMTTTNNAKRIIVKETLDGNTWSEIETITIGTGNNTQYKSSKLNTAAKGVQFYVRGAYDRSVWNVQVKRATTLTASNVSFNEASIGTTNDKTITVTYSNGFNPQTFSAITSSTGFSVKSISTTNITAETGTIDVTFSFTPTSATNYSGTARLQLGSVTKDISLSGTGTINKANPAFEWNIPSTVYTGRLYTNVLQTSNSECTPTMMVEPETMVPYVHYSNGNLFFSKVGNVRITFSQDESDHFNKWSETNYFTIEEPQNHVEFTINDATKYNMFVVEESNSDRIGYDNGIRLGTTNQIVSVSDRSDKYVIIEFSGIPDKLSFTTTVAQSGLIPSGISFYVQEIDGNGVYYSDPEQWTSTEKENTVNKQLQPTTRKLKVCYSGNYWAHIKNLKVTELKKFDVDKTELFFGENTKGENVEEQTFAFEHCNAGTDVTITSNDANFVIYPTTLNTTGGDLMGTQVITVTYLNNTTGVHNGTITISDPNGTNSPITINVSGTTQTTYYTRAEAEAGVGGSAYVSYVSSEDAAANQHTSTSLKISELTSEDKATNNAYWIAIPEQGYTFVEWQWPNGTQASTNASDKWEGYEYNSEDQNSPTVVKFKAVFAPKILTLQPTSSTYTADYYKTVNLGWALKSGYSTIALPFNTTIQDIVGAGYDSSTDWVAQLSVVAYNAQDGYSLYFEKKSEIVANQPYILHLGSAVNSPVFTNVSVVAAATASQNATKGVNLNKWTMHSNFAPDFDMEGFYGIAGEKIKKGVQGSTLSAFRAYITGPADPSVQVKAAYLDYDEADGLLEVLRGEAHSAESVYDLQGRQLPKAQRGLNIIRGADGVVMKVLKK